MKDRIQQLVRRGNAFLGRYPATRVLRATVAGFFAHEALQYAGAMAYFAILSLVNVFILGVVAASYIVGQGTARQFVIDRANQGLPVDPSAIGNLIDRAVDARGSVGIIGGVLLLWSALGVFGALSSGISRVFIRAPKRAFWKDRLIGLSLLLATAIIAGASVGIGLATQTLEDAVSAYVTVPGLSTLFSILTVVTPILLIFVAFLLIYRIVPNRPVTIGESWPGALIATLLWTALRIGFTYYATNVAKYNSVYGPIGTALSLLVFLYFSSVVLLIGAEFVRATALEAEARARPQAVVAEQRRDSRTAEAARPHEDPQ